MTGLVPFTPAPGKAPTMSSREIAELLGTRHDSVKRSVERLAAGGVIVQPPLVDEPDTDSMGRVRTTSVYRLDKRSSLIVVAQLSPEFTARVVDRWQELEATVATAINLDDPATLRALLDRQAALRMEEQAKLAEASAVLARLTEAEGSFTVTEVAKMLGIGRKALFEWLSANGWTYRHTPDSAWLGYAAKVRAGLLEHVEYLQPQEDGSEKARVRIRVTPKGAAELAKLLTTTGTGRAVA